MALHSEMGEELTDFGCTHLAGMTFAVKENKAADPVDVSFLRAKAVVTDSDGSADLVEEPQLFGSRCILSHGVSLPPR